MASIYDKKILSKADLERIENLNEAYRSETDKKTKEGIHKQAEAIRNSYGYSGGDDGSQFILNNGDVMNTASASKGYTDALENAKDAEAQNFAYEAQRIKQDSADRLREAYIKNMHDSLGLNQKLKAAGVSGGAAESTVAYMENVYNNNRNEINKDTSDKEAELEREKILALAKADTDIAKAEYDGAIKRSDILRDAENEAYDRQIAEREFEFKKSTDQRDFDYQKAKDERDFEYQKQQDAISNSISQSKATSSSSNSGSSKMSAANVLSLIKEGVYNPNFADILGITDDEVRAMVDDFGSAEAKEVAWKLMDKGLYDDSFPELVGYSEEVLQMYVGAVLNGF